MMLLPFAFLLPEEQFFLGTEVHDPMYGLQAAYFSELFGTHLRYCGASIGYQLASVVGRHLTAHHQIRCSRSREATGGLPPRNGSLSVITSCRPTWLRLRSRRISPLSSPKGKGPSPARQDEVS